MRDRHRPPPTLLAAGLALLGTTLAAAPAAAVSPRGVSPVPSEVAAQVLDSCSLRSPARVLLEGETTTVVFRLAGDCPVGAWARWDVLDPAGAPLKRISLTQGTSASVRLGARSPLGSYRLHPVNAYGEDYDQIVQGAATMPVGTRSRTSVTASRSAATVTLAATVSTYGRTGQRYVPRPDTGIELQRSTCASGCPWTVAASGRTDTAGRAVLSAVSPRRSYWRTVARASSTAGDSMSTVLAP